MATSGTITGSFNGSNAQYLTFRCDWSVTSQDLANKTSNVRLRWIVTKTTSNLYTNKSSTPWSQTCNGTTTSGSLSFNLGNVSANTDYVVRDVTVTIPHNADGTKTASISGTLDLSGTSAGTGTFSGSMALPTIATTPPTVSSLTLTDVGTKPSGVSAYVAGYTKFRLTATASATSPATVSTYAFYNGNTLLQSGSSNVFTYSAANTAGSYSFKVIVTDSYGNSTTKTNSAVTVVAYSMPTITATTYRSNSSGTADGSGTYIQCSVTGTVANISGNKVASLVGNITPTIGSHTFATNANSPASGTWRPSGAATSTAYTVTYTVTDSFGSVATISQTVQSEFINFDLYPGTSGGAAFGQVAESNKFIVNHPTEFNNGNVLVNSGNVYAGQATLDAEHYCEARSTGGRIEISSKSDGRGIWIDGGGWVMFTQVGSNTPTWTGNLSGNASTASNLGFTGTVGASTNLNNITTLGKYYEPSSGSSYMPSNVPPGMTEAFVLYVVSANGSGNISGNWAYGQQILKTISGDRVYMRPMSTNGSGTLSFGDWTLIAGVTKSLWSGTLTNSALTIANGYLYNQYIIYGLPSGGSASTVVIPKSVVGTSDTQFELADNAGYRTFKIRHSGYDLIITGVGAYNGGVINSVHGAV